MRTISGLAKVTGIVRLFGCVRLKDTIEFWRGMDVVEEAVAVEKVHGATGGNDHDAGNEHASVLIHLDLFAWAGQAALAGGFSSQTTAFLSSFCGDNKQVPCILRVAADVLIDGYVDLPWGRNGTDEDNLAVDGAADAQTRRAQKRKQQHRQVPRESHSAHSTLLAILATRVVVIATHPSSYHTDASMRRYADAPMRRCADAPMRRCADAPMRRCADAPMRRCADSIEVSPARRLGQEELFALSWCPVSLSDRREF